MLGKIYNQICRYHPLCKIINYVLAGLNKNTVFIWIPKAAGTSVYNCLRRRGCLLFKDIESLRKLFPQKGLTTFGHMNYFELIENGFIKKIYADTAFKFCFVRNPYARAVSLYFYLKPSRISSDTTFKLFCYKLKEKAYDKIGLYNSKGLSQCNPQINWICDRKGKVDVDFIGKVETIDKDFEKLARLIGIKKKLKLPRVNTTGHNHFLDYYDSETLKIIENVYQEDFDCFEYPVQKSTY